MRHWRGYRGEEDVVSGMRHWRWYSKALFALAVAAFGAVVWATHAWLLALWLLCGLGLLRGYLVEKRYLE